MNARMKKRLTVVTLVIVAVMALILAVVGSSSAAKTVTVAEAAEGAYAGSRIQVTGNVVPNSYDTQDNVLTFQIYDTESAQVTLPVSYEGVAASTFGNDVTAICTGKMDDAGVLQCSELVTKCPSKYESGTQALQVVRLLEYGESVIGKTVKVTGTVVAGSQNAAGQGERFVLADTEDAGKTLPVDFDGAASQEVLASGAQVVLTGNMTDAGTFSATAVALAE